MLERKRLSESLAPGEPRAKAEIPATVANEHREDRQGIAQRTLALFSVGWVLVGVAVVAAGCALLALVIQQNAETPLETHEGRAATQAELVEAKSWFGVEPGTTTELEATGVLYGGPSGTAILARFPDWRGSCLIVGDGTSNSGGCGLDLVPRITTFEVERLLFDDEFADRFDMEPGDLVTLMAFDDRLEVWPVDPSPSPSPTSE